MEMHSSDLHVCIDISKCALFCAKFAMSYLLRKKGNVIIQHYNIKEGLSHILKKIREMLPSIKLIVLFQHPNPSANSIVQNVLITGMLECMEMCFIEIVSSVQFVYYWHPNRNCWDINELKSIIMQKGDINLLLCLIFSNDRSIAIQVTTLVDHPTQGLVKRRGWAQMKLGDERTFCVKKRIRCYVM